MEHPVPPVTGYRPLSQEDIDLMNAVKAKAAELLALHDQIAERAMIQSNQLWADQQNAETLIRAADQTGDADAMAEAQKNSEAVTQKVARWQAAEPMRWAAIGRTDIQQGVMALVRAIAQPDSIC
ncbi:hypothetical protein CTA21_16335 [Salmonella enterica]|nr:hypothetical protein [Salmonella enterica]EDZ0839898.1 hypothetical protein [Salmonella enterica subsp. enterica serovar Saintpaul]EEC1302896.1 hypothetical protein [Salmonella enterica]